MRIALRVIVALLFAVWWGGFTFYAAVVVPIGQRVLGSATAQGFVTQPVSDRINVIGAVVIAVLCWNLVAARRGATPRVWRVLVISWAVLAVAQVVLFVLHPRLDGMLDMTTRSIAAEHSAFYAAHRVYLLVATAQWLAATVHAVAVGYAWAGRNSPRA
jgi:glucan phosphoethanolaminetransferase (alkaline phosphatase superfamily)